MKNLSILASFAAATLIASPAFAEPAEVERVVISTADLDLASASGVRELDRRVASAAASICDVQRLHADTDVTTIDLCLRQVKSTAREQVAAQIAIAERLADRSVALASSR